MVRGHPAGGTRRVVKNGVAFGCRAKPLQSSTSWRDPAVYYYAAGNKWVAPGKNPQRGDYKRVDPNSEHALANAFRLRQEKKAIKHIMRIKKGGSRPSDGSEANTAWSFSGKKPSTGYQKLLDSLDATTREEAERIRQGLRKKIPKKPKKQGVVAAPEEDFSPLAETRAERAAFVRGTASGARGSISLGGQRRGGRQLGAAAAKNTAANRRKAAAKKARQQAASRAGRTPIKKRAPASVAVPSGFVTARTSRTRAQPRRLGFEN